MTLARVGIFACIPERRGRLAIRSSLGEDWRAKDGGPDVRDFEPSDQMARQFDRLRRFA
jgi:hypothetical protein